MKQRDIVKSVIFSLITCGIYGIFWFIELTDEVAKENQDYDFSGGKSLLFTVITCGIYGIYWNYKMGKELYEIQVKRGIDHPEDQSILYLILSLLGFSMISYILMQSEVNKLANN